MNNNLISRSDRVKKLDNAILTLKSEFIGLDSILDEIKESISSWYITPEVNSRPVVISLWGMTGTGKSSVVRRLIELLDLSNESIFFDCGECQDSDKSISSSINDTFGYDQDNLSTSLDKLVFVFDEFQYARTINDSGEEEVKPSIRPIWSVLDSGILDISDNYSWEFNRLVGFIEDLEPLAIEYPNIKVSNNKVINPVDVKPIVDSLGFIYYNRDSLSILSSKGVIKTSKKRKKDDDLDDSEDPYRPITLIEGDLIRTLIKRCNLIELGFGNKVAHDLVNGDKSLGEIVSKLKEVKSKIQRPKSIDCSKSLVFVIGNLDEAFGVSGDTNPDMSADTFYDITSKVTISDIKGALKKRFRPEQIARLGNNLIKYPTLRESDFRKIIKLELDKIIKRFNKDIDSIKINITEDIENLLYSEGVYPTQGVRPIFTTINTIVTPYLSKILIEKSTSSNLITNVEIGIEHLDLYKFKVPEITIYLKYSNKDIEVCKKTYKQNLQLGAIRDPRKRLKRYICSVHEAGHAVVFTKLTGNIPDTIVSVSTDHGGFCSTYEKDTFGEIQSRLDIDNYVRISLGGYLSEDVFYKDRPEMCLMGSRSDLQEAWVVFTDAVCKIGYFEPALFGSWEIESGFPEPGGFDMEKTGVYYFDGKKYDYSDRMSVIDATRKRFNELTLDTKKIIEEEKELIKQTALVLGERGSISGEEYLELVNKYGKDINISEIKKQNSFDYYLDVLKN